MDRVSDNTCDWAEALAAPMRGIARTNMKLPSTGLPLYRQRDASGRSQAYRPATRSFRRKKDLLSFTLVFTDLPVETATEPREARSRGDQRGELLGYFEGARKQELDAVLFEWDQWVERAKEVADPFSQQAGRVEEVRQLIHECLELDTRYMLVCAERYAEALRAM
jgi:hypothetical protein